jgi:hypothetical protein
MRCPPIAQPSSRPAAHEAAACSPTGSTSRCSPRGTRGATASTTSSSPPLWKRAAALAAEYGLVATAYERRTGALARRPVRAGVPLQPVDGRVHLPPRDDRRGRPHAPRARQRRALERALPHLTQPRPGPRLDLRPVDDRAHRRLGRGPLRDRRAQDPDGRLAALRHQVVLQRDHLADGAHPRAPRGQPPGGRGLALFYVETPRRRRAAPGHRGQPPQGQARHAQGPTAELTLDGTPAIAVAGLTDGVRAITPMLNITRTWNAVCAVSLMRRGLALARDYARRRVAFGALARRQAPAPRHPRGPSGRGRGGLPPRLPRRRAARPRRGGEATDEERNLLRPSRRS